MSIKSIDEERNLHLDKPGKGKSLEQIKKHTIDTGLDGKPIDRAMHLLTSGDDVQKISVIQALPQLTVIDSTATFTRILPKIQQDLSHSSCEIQITASKVFKTMVESHSNLSILNSIIGGVESKDPNVALSWSESLLGVIPVLNEDVIKNTILPIAKNKTATNTPAQSKIFCSKLLGKIATYPRLKLIDVKKDILPLTLSLCQDVNSDVRAAMCASLPMVARGIGNNFIKTDLLPSLVELAQDENCNVRGAAIIAISSIVYQLDNATKTQTMLPLLKKLCEKSMAKEDTTAMILADEFGSILNGMEHCISPADVQYFLKCFKTYSQRGKMSAAMDPRIDASKEVICRERCANNVLAVLKFGLKVAPDQVPFIYGIYRELAADPCYLVRRSAAGNISYMAKSLGEQNKLMKNEIVRLLRDDAIEVLDLLVPSIANTLLCLVDYGSINNNATNQTSVDIGRALFKCHTELSKVYNWRLTVQFLTQLECLPFCMPADFIHNNFTPILLDKVLSGKARPIRQQAIRTLICFLRYNFKPNQHKWLRDTLIKQIALSPNCYTRVLYVNLCEAVLDYCSEKYFKDFILPNLLTLATDKIANVRYSFVQFTTRLKYMVTLQSDVKTRQLINETISRLETNERSKFILELIRQKKRDPLPKRIEERMREEEKRMQEETSCQIKRPRSNFVLGNAAAPLTNPKVAEPKKPHTPTPTPQQSQASADMAFLEQHFYIDAGISLPKDSCDLSESNSSLEPPHPNDYVIELLLPSVLNNILAFTDCECISSTTTPKEVHSDDVNDNNNDSVVDEGDTTNMTDDVKVNLRLNKSKITPPKNYSFSCENVNDNNVINARPKRYSSVLSVKCIEEKDEKVKNRRSLNISQFTQKESKIPIIVSSKRLSNIEASIEQQRTTEENKPKSVSQLPILAKRRLPQPQRRK